MKLRSKAGQIAIFVILIFQVLFVLFAMTINVALISHDKINLQSSLDMAALYGAQKQAEVLNVISHINFQMRQNYKLLAWRYRILGTVAHADPSAPGPIYCPRRREAPKNENDCLTPSVKGVEMSPSYSGFYDRYFFCSSVPLWGVGTAAEDFQCRNNGFSVTKISIHSVSPVIPFSSIYRSQSLALRKLFQQGCEANASNNAGMAHLFLTHFRLDQKDRRLMVQSIFDKTLKQGRDLDGQPIRDGMLKTFTKNLTYANLKNFQEGNSEELFKDFNSFQGKNLSSFLKPIRIFANLGYLYTDKDCSGSVKWTMGQTDNDKISKIVGASGQLVNIFKQLISLNQNIPTDPNLLLQNLVVGFEPVEKDVFYYGASASVSYNSVTQLFFPFIGSKEGLSLQASSFSKPFGGKLGPPKTADPLLAHLIKAGEGQAGSQLAPYLYQPNYGLFPGDPFGLVRRELHEQFYLKKENKGFIKNRGNYYNGVHYTHLYPTVGGSPSGGPLPSDALANDFNGGNLAYGNPLLGPRLMELTAIAPDVFDMTYYSILNNYMETYFPKICKLIGQNQSSCNPQKLEFIRGVGEVQGAIRGDFGYPYTQIYRNQNKQAHKSLVSLSPFFFHFKTLLKMNLNPEQKTYYHENRMPYLIRDPAHTLTSWSPTIKKDRYNSYTFPETFMGCRTPASKNSTALLNPSGCAQGGRSGYSVKLISCSHVRTFPNPPPSFNNICQG